MNNPTLTRDQAMALARSRGCTDEAMLLGLRSPTSQYGQYDDTIALLTPSIYLEWKANTLPSKWGPGIGKLMDGDWKWKKGLHGVHHFAEIEKALGTAKCKEVADLLNEGLAEGRDYPYILKDSNDHVLIVPYPALRQAAPMAVLRYGHDTPETIIDPNDWPYCDGHSGGWQGTSSLMCQTWFPDHWVSARRIIYSTLDLYRLQEITYGLHQL